MVNNIQNKISQRYLDTCLEGYKYFGFDNKYLL